MNAVRQAKLRCDVDDACGFYMEVGEMVFTSTKRKNRCRRLRLLIPGVLLGAMVAGTPAVAQTRGPVGLAFGVPGSIGVVWHVNERLALRPEISLAGSSADSTAGKGDRAAVSSTKTSELGTGTSVLVYLQSRQSLRTYVSPRLVYVRSRISSSSGQSETSTKVVVGSFGAPYVLGERVSIFGELGLGVSRLTTTSTFTVPVASRGTLVRTRTAMGRVLYF